MPFRSDPYHQSYKMDLLHNNRGARDATGRLRCDLPVNISEYVDLIYNKD